MNAQPTVPASIADLWHDWEFRAAQADSPDGADRERAIRAALSGVETIVNATAQGRFRVTLSAQEATAATDVLGRRVSITSAALVDPNLSEDARLCVTTAMALHEAGHTSRECRAHQSAVDKAFPNDALAAKVSNVLDDVFLEAEVARDRPAYAPVFDVALWWVASRYPAKAVTRTGRTVSERMSACIAAARYGDYVTFGTDPDVQEDRAWWADWAKTYSAHGAAKLHVDGVRVALDRIRPAGLSDPEPEPEPIPGKGEGQGEDAPQGAPEPGAGQPEPGEGSGQGDGSEPATGDGGEDDGSHAFHGEHDAEGAFDPDAPTGTGYSQSTNDVDARSEHEPEVSGDALESPLPVHASDAVTQDDRNRDIALGRRMDASARRVAPDRIDVTIGTMHRSVYVRPVKGRRTVSTSPEEQGALRAAFAGRRTARDNKVIGRSGRLSASRAFRVKLGNPNVFTRAEGVSPDRLDVHVLVDLSGSMEGVLPRASILAANLAEGLSRMPTVRVHVWGHNTMDGVTLWDAWDSRKGGTLSPIGGMVAAGANADGTAIAGVAAIAKRERSRRERTIIAVLSDGAPCEPEPYVRSAVDMVREDGTGVFSVAISGGLTKTQEACYGPDAVVEYDSDFSALGHRMAQVIARLA